MGGSAKRARRRAADPALRYAHVPGARTSGRRPGRRREPRERRGWRAGLRSAGFALGVLSGVSAGCAALVLGPLRWSGELWHAYAPGWPGEGYGFVATAGLLLPVAVFLAGAALFRTDWKRHRVRSALWTALALPGAGAALMLFTVAVETVKPKGSHRHGGCTAAGEYCWVSGHYPYAWLVALAAVVLGVLACAGLSDAYRRLRRPVRASGQSVRESRARGLPAPGSSDV